MYSGFYSNWKMIENKDKLRIGLYSLFIITSLIILADFMIGGRVVVDEIIGVKKERQQYYNAARNDHYTYRISTRKHSFFVTADFAKKILDKEKVEYTVSRIFSKVNRYKLLNSENSEMSSLRFLSGLFIPLLVIMVLGIAFKYKKKMSVLVFVIQVLLIVDLIFLIK